MTPGRTTNTKPRRRWLQFSLKTLLALVVLLSLPLAWLGSKLDHKRRESEAVTAIEKLNAWVEYDWSAKSDTEAPGPNWLRRWLGNDFFATVKRVTFRTGNDLTDAELVHFERLNGVKELNLQDAYVTNAGVFRLAQLKAMRVLKLEGTHVTAVGVAELRKALPDCEISRYDHSSNDGLGYEKTKFNGYTRFFAPIHEAAQIGDVVTIQEELDEGVPVDLRVVYQGAMYDPNDTTPLMWAAARGKVCAVRQLIEAGADVNARTLKGVTALMAAAGAIPTIAGDPEACVQALLEAGANPDTTDSSHRTAAFYACGEGTFFDDPPKNLVPQSLRLHRPFLPFRPGARGLVLGKRKGEWPTDRVVKSRHGDAPRLKWLIDAGADIHVVADSQNDVLAVAAMAADAERIRLLLSAGGDIERTTRKGLNALQLAAAYGNAAMFELLLDAGSKWEPSLLPWTAKAYEDVDEKVRLLLARGANVNEADSDGRTALLCALECSPTAAARLLQAGADPHVRARHGECALVIAAQYTSATVLESLLKRGFDVDERSVWYQHSPALALAAASEFDSAAKVRLLLAAGAKVDAKDDNGVTALLEASREGNMEAVVVLVEAGANVNVVDQDKDPDYQGMMPLLYVANRGRADAYLSEQTGGAAARALIRHGANVNACDRRGRTAWRLAEEIDHKEVLEVLDEVGR